MYRRVYPLHSLACGQIASLRGRISRTMENPARPLRVYLVEDSTILLSRLREALERLGVEIVGHADNAATALREITALAPDAVIVDIALRRSNGFELLRALAQDDPRPRPVAIVLSNYTSEPYRDAARRLGVEYYFDKSNDILAFLDVVASLARATGVRNGSEHP